MAEQVEKIDSTRISKNSQGHGYKYTDIAGIHEYLESKGITYYQEIKSEDGVDYIYTTPIIDGKEQPARRGARMMDAVLARNANPVQAYGAGLTYARRYSLLMAFGLATEDDDAASIVEPKTTKAQTQVASASRPKRKNDEKKVRECMAKRGVGNLAKEFGLENTAQAVGEYLLYEVTEHDLDMLLKQPKEPLKGF